MALAAAPSRRFSTAPPRLQPSSSLQRHAHLRPQNPRRSPPPLLAATAAAPLAAADTEGRKHELLRAVQETRRGSVASPDQRAAIEEAIVCVEELGAGQGAPLDLAALDGTWRLCYTSASDVLMLFEAAERLPLLQVGQIYQKFECKGRSDGGIVRNVVRWSIENLLEEQEGATLMVSAKFDVQSKRNIFLQFKEVAVENIKISEQLQALIAPAILPRSFLSLQPCIQEVKKLLTRCANLRASRRAYREEVEQALVKKDTAEKRAAELEGELEALRKEREELRAAKEAAAQTRDELVPTLRSMVDDLSGVLGRTLPSADFEASDALRDAVKVAKDAVKLVKAATGKASGALGALHEAIYPDAETPGDFEGLAGSFDAEGGFLKDFARDNSVRGLQSALVVLLSHGVPGNFDSMVSSVPAVSPDIMKRARVLARKLQETLEKRKKK